MRQLYSKAQLERDLAGIEQARHLARERYLEGDFDGFGLQRSLDALDKLERKLKGKLYATAQYLQERDAKKRKKAPGFTTSDARWKSCTEAEYIRNLSLRSDQGGCTVRSVEMKGLRRYEKLE